MAKERVSSVGVGQLVPVTLHRRLDAFCKQANLRFRSLKEPAARLSAAAERLVEWASAGPVQRAQAFSDARKFVWINVELERADESGLKTQPFRPRVAR